MSTTTHLQYDIISGDKHTRAWIHKYHGFLGEFQEKKTHANNRNQYCWRKWDKPKYNKCATARQNQQNDLYAQRRLWSVWASAKSDQSLLCAQWVAKDPRLLRADSEHSDQTDGWTDKHDVYRTITFNRSCNVLKVNPSGKKTVPNVCQNRRPYRTQILFQFSASPSPFLGTTENATFAHFMKKAMYLKPGFLLDYQVLFLLLNGPQIEKKFEV